MQIPDPRAIRAELQARQSDHAAPVDHQAAVSAALATATRPDLVAALLSRAGAKLAGGGND